MSLFGLPSPRVLLEPVTCKPAWMARFEALPDTTITSGCAVNSSGNVPCDPSTMAAAAGKKIGRDVSLEAYTLARYITTEVGTKSVGERVAVAQDAINRVRYIETKTKNILNLLLYRQDPNGSARANRGFYGPIHKRNADGSTDVGEAPYGRWAATSRDPTYSNLLLAIAVLDGEIPRDFNKGADDQNGPEIFVARNGVAATQAGIRYRGSQRKYWVGPLPGVDHMRTYQFRTLKDVAPDSELGRTLIERGVQAIAAGRPDWDGLPTCPEVTPSQGLALGASAIVVLGAGFVMSRLLARRLDALV